MGSRARARDGGGTESGATESITEETVPAADDFWGEGAAAVHSAIQPSSGRAMTPPSSAAERDDSSDRLKAPSRRLRTDRTRPHSRRAWGFSVRSTPAVAHRSTGPAKRFGAPFGVGRPGWFRRRTVAIAAAIACLLAVSAVGLAEGGGHPSRAARGLSAVIAVPGSGEEHQLGPTAGGLPIADRSSDIAAGTTDAAGGTRTGNHTKESRERTAARAQARRRRLARQKAAPGERASHRSDICRLRRDVDATGDHRAARGDETIHGHDPEHHARVKLEYAGDPHDLDPPFNLWTDWGPRSRAFIRRQLTQ